MTSCNRYDDDWDLLLLGTLDPERSTAMRAHVASGCSGCGERWLEASRLMGALGATAEVLEPPSRVEQRLLQRLLEVSAETVPTPVVRPWRRATTWRVASAAAALAILAAGGSLARQNAELRRRLADVERRLASTAAATPPAASAAVPPTAAPVSPAGPGPEVARWEGERAQLEQARSRAESARDAAEAEVVRLGAAQRSESLRSAAELDAQQRRVEQLQHTVEQLRTQVGRLEADLTREARAHAAAMRVALDERSTRVVLRAVDPLAGRATATATLSPEGRLLLAARGLPPLPPNKCYQLWVIQRDGPAIVSGGVVSVSGDGHALYETRVEGQAARVTGFALTDEPLGGSQAARGRKLLFGSVQR